YRIALGGGQPLVRRPGRVARAVDRGEVGGEGRAGDALPAVVRLDAAARGDTEAAAKLGGAEQKLDGRPQRGDVAGREEEAGAAALDEVREAADGGGDDGLAVRHRLGADDAEPLGERRADDDGGALEAALELGARDEPARRHEVAERPVAGDDEV